MKKILAVCFVLIMAQAAFAATVDTKYFKVEVPDGWTVERESNSANLMAPDNSAVITIIYEELGGDKFVDVLNGFSKDLNGTAPKADEDGTYHFSFKGEDGTEFNAFAEEADGKLVLICIGGEHKDIEKILDTLEDK